MCSTSLLLILCYDPRKVRPIDLSMSLQTATKLSIMKSESKKEKKLREERTTPLTFVGFTSKIPKPIQPLKIVSK